MFHNSLYNIELDPAYPPPPPLDSGYPALFQPDETFFTHESLPSQFDITPSSRNPFSYLPKIDESITPQINYCVFRKTTPVWQIKEGLFSSWSLTYLTGGTARYTIDGAAYDLAAGDLLCLPPGHVRSANTWPNHLMDCFAVEFTLTSTEQDPQLPFSLISHIGIQDDLLHLFHELVYVWIDCQPFYSIKARALLLLILHRLLELVFSHTPSSLKDIRIEKAVNHITRHYEKKISIREMAAMTGLNATYFGVLFRQETGMSMNRYLIRTRIRNAEYMLRSGNHTVEETAKRCGYSDKWYFYKQFKKVCGIPPSACIPKKKRY